MIERRLKPDRAGLECPRNCDFNYWTTVWTSPDPDARLVRVEIDWLRWWAGRMFHDQSWPCIVCPASVTAAEYQHMNTEARRRMDAFLLDSPNSAA